MHASTRILVILVALAAIAAGWWLLAISNTLVAAVAYGALWAAAVLLATFVLIKIGFGYNRFTARRSGDPAHDPRAALAELTRLRQEGLISPEEYEAKRAKILDRL